MKKLLIILLTFTFSLSTVTAKDEVTEYDYELKPVNDTPRQQGWVIFKVLTTGKKKELLTKDLGQQNAIKGLLFKGLQPDKDGGGQVNALVEDGYEAHKEFFDSFFESGDYKQFIQTHEVQGADIVKLKKGYKVGYTVEVNLKQLRRRLEKHGIIESVRSIFRR